MHLQAGSQIVQLGTETDVMARKTATGSHRPGKDGGRTMSALEACRLELDKVRASKERYSSIVNNISDGCFEVTLSGTIVFCNQAAIEMSGYSREEIIGQHWRRFCQPKTVERVGQALKDVAASGQTISISDCELVNRQGFTVTVEATLFPVRNRSGKVTGFRGLIKDVSEHRQLEKYRQKLETQLQQAQKMEAIGTLAAGVAHGFNNVLMGIQGSLALIKMNLGGRPSVERQLDRIEECINKGVELARQIQGFARASKFVVMPTNLNDILQSTSRIFARELPNLTICEFYTPDLWEVEIDRVQLGQALLNLFAYAADNMTDGGKLYLHTENVILGPEDVQAFKVQPGAYVKISVGDTGPGIDESVSQRIFEPFFRQDQLADEGLRLASVYGIVTGHKGVINVYSELGHGTAFIIYLPVAKRETRCQNIFPRRLPKGDETILLIDDDPMALSVASSMLSRLGYRLRAASSGREGLTLLEACPGQIDLVVLDVFLADMEARAVYEGLRRVDPGIIVLLASGYSMNPAIESLLAKGCRGLINKPFTLYMLAEKVRNAIDERKRNATS